MYRVIVRNSGGYTLINALYNLAVLIIMSQILILIFIIYFQNINLQDDRDEMEWQLFVKDLNIYFERSHSVYIDNLGKTVYFMDPMARNKIEYKIQIRDRHITRASIVGGHEIILPYILHARFYLNDGILRVEAIMKSGKIREREFVVATFSK
jgi:competence protein ComGF